MTQVEQSSRPEPLVRPPRLHLGREGTASRLELFFDLAYVLVVMELAKSFYENLTWNGLLVLTGLFVTIWFSWVGFTLYANRFDTDDVVFRIAKLAATASIVGCAASASDAVGKFAVPFAACYLGSVLVLFALYLRAWRHVSEARPTIAVYLLSIGTAAVLWSVSLVVAEPARYVLWGVAVAVSAAGPLLASLRSDKVPLHIEHLPERFALLVILMLGEAVGGAARGVHDAGWATGPVIIGVLAFVVAAGMWWVYFDITAPSSNRELHEAEDEAQDNAGEEGGGAEDSSGDAGEGDVATQEGSTTDGAPDDGADSNSGDGEGDGEGDAEATDERHDLFVYGHLPLTFGIVLAGVGLEELVVHPDTANPSLAGFMFAAGLAIFLAGVALVISGTAQTLRAIWPWPLAAIPLVLLGALVPFPSSLAMVAVYAAGMLALAWEGTRASRRPDNVLAGAD